MTRSHRQRPLSAVHRALDEARFGRERILNLRASLPTAADAMARAEAWLRERQVARAGEVLVITGRGNHSADGISVVRQAVLKRLALLRRRGVVESFVEHTPGSFVVRLAALSALRSAPRRKKDRERLLAGEPAALDGLGADTRALLRRLAVCALEELGVEMTEAFVRREMLAQFAYIATGVPEGADREARLRAAIGDTLAECEDR
jgi:hypothetical protein